MTFQIVNFLFISNTPNMEESGMGNLETLATFDRQDTGRRQSRDIGNIWQTRHRTKKIQRHWQHLTDKTQDEDNPETLATFDRQDTRRRQSRDIGNIWQTRHRTKTNKAQKHNTTQHRKLKRWKTWNPPNTWVEPSFSGKVSNKISSRDFKSYISLCMKTLKSWDFGSLKFISLILWPYCYRK